MSSLQGRFPPAAFDRLRKQRQTLLGTHTFFSEQLLELSLVRFEARPIRFRVPEVQHGCSHAPVATPYAVADHTDKYVGVLPSPAGERRIESVDRIQVTTPKGHVAAAGAAPPACLCARCYAWPWQQQRTEPIHPATDALRNPRCQSPALRRQVVLEDARGELARQQKPAAINEPPRARQTAMRRDKAGSHEAVAVQEDTVASGTHANGTIPDLGQAKAFVFMPNVLDRDVGALGPGCDDATGLGA